MEQRLDVASAMPFALLCSCPLRGRVCPGDPPSFTPAQNLAHGRRGPCLRGSGRTAEPQAREESWCTPCTFGRSSLQRRLTSTPEIPYPMSRGKKCYLIRCHVGRNVKGGEAVREGL